MSGVVRSIFPQSEQRYSPSEGSSFVVHNTQKFNGGITAAGESIAFPGDRWRMTFSFDSPGGNIRRELQAWAVAMQGHKHRFYAHDWSYKGPYGATSSWNIAAPDLEYVFNDVSSWNAQWSAPSSGYILNNNNYWLSLTSVVSHAQPVIIGKEFSTWVEQDKPYFFRVENRLKGPFPHPAPRIGFASNPFGADYYPVDFMDDNGVFMGSFVPTTTTLWCRLYGGKGNNEQVLFANLQVSRCALVEEADQTGDVIRVWGLEPNEAASLAAGDYVEFTNPSSMQSSLHTLVADADTTFSDSGSALLYLSTPIRFVPNSGSAVVLHRPSAIMTMAEAGFGWGYNNVDRSVFTMDMEESIYGR